MRKNTERFADTVENYIKYRPSYPPELLQLLIDQCELTKDKIVADIGSGTGILTQIILDNGNLVFAVEPNQAMRQAAEKHLHDYALFRSVNGTAEATTLVYNSVDLITVGTAFHWFDAVKAKTEFKRIIKSNGFIALAWNVRDQNTKFIAEYEKIISKYNKDYQITSGKKFEIEKLKEFFAPHPMHEQAFAYKQVFNLAGLQGRLLSSSYALRPTDSQYTHMMNELEKIFNEYQENGKIQFNYKTMIYYGRFK